MEAFSGKKRVNSRMISPSSSINNEKKNKSGNLYILKNFIIYVLGSLFIPFVCIFIVICVVPLLPPQKSFSYSNVPWFVVQFPFWIFCACTTQASVFEEFIGVPYRKTITKTFPAMLFCAYIPQIVILALGKFPVPLSYGIIAAFLWMGVNTSIMIFMAKRSKYVDQSMLKRNLVRFFIYGVISGFYFIMSTFYMFVFKISDDNLQPIVQILYIGFVLAFKEINYQASKFNNLYVYLIEFISDIFIFVAIPSSHNIVSSTRMLMML